LHKVSYLFTEPSPNSEHAAEPHCDAVESSADTEMLVKAF